MTQPQAKLTDEQYLDAAFDRIVAAFEEGQSPRLDELLAARPHLRSQLDELLQLAEQITLSPRRSWPHIRGYRILSELGRGGMGCVYLAQQERLGDRPVALKVLPDAAALSPRARERFLSEARAIARVRHANVVAIHDVVQQDGLLAYAMEWVDGCTLAQWIVEQGSGTKGSRDREKKGSRDQGIKGSSEDVGQRALDPFIPRSLDPFFPLDPSPTAFICRLGVAIARALAAVHAAGLLHRDVKPGNILIRRDGTPLLSDFGLVRDTDATLTQPGSFAGTPAYAAPEQLRGESDKLDARSDVYALGVTLYHALARRLPFSASTPDAILRQVESGRITPLRKLNNRVPLDLDTIISKAIDADPQRRYPSAAELADDLERLLNLQPIRARPASLLTRTIKLARRNRASLVGLLLGAGGAVALSLLLVVYFFWVPRWVAQHTREARLALLDPHQQTQLFNALFFYDQSVHAPDVRAVALEGLDEALGAYARALRLRPWNDAIRCERDVVRLAYETVAAARRSPDSMQSAHVDRPESVAEASVRPCCREYSRRLLATGTHAPAAELRLDERSADELRDLGLLAYLLLDLQTAIAAWAQLDRHCDADALVDAAIGQAFLLLDQPARAYPRLRAANEVFPHVGFLTTALADAALQCGDFDKAGRLIAQARGMSRLPGMDGLERIEARQLAATGQDDLARRKFEWLLSPGHGSVVAQVDYARFFAARGEHAKAVRQYAAVIRSKDVQNRRVHMEFTGAMDRWWASLSCRERRQVIRGALDEASTDPRSFVVLLREYVAAAALEDGAARSRSGSVATAGLRPRRDAAPRGWRPWLHPDAGTRFSAQSAALSASDSSPSLETREMVSLSVLARRMEVSDMSFWSALQAYPAFAKDALTAVWLAPRSAAPARWLQAAVGLESRVRSRVRAALAACALSAALASMSPGGTFSYAPNLGTLPEAQGWTRHDNPPGSSPEPAVVGGALHQGPTAYSGGQNWDNVSVPIDFDLGFSLDMQLDVVSSTYNGINSTGYAFGVVDAQQRWFVIGISSSGVFVGNTQNWTGTPFTPFNTMGQHAYQFAVTGGTGVLLIDTTPIASLAVGSPTSYPPNQVWFGDGTSYGSSETYLGGLTYTAFVLGDMNCDGTVNVLDINPFVLALSDPAEYMNQHSSCNIANGDINDDGNVDVLDINPFVALLSGG